MTLPPILENPHFYLVVVPVLVVVILFLLFRQSAAADISMAIFALFASASKIVFIMIAATVCGAFLGGKLDGKDFMVLAGMVFTYYFNMRRETPMPPEKEVPPLPEGQELPPPTVAEKLRTIAQDLHAIK